MVGIWGFKTPIDFNITQKIVKRFTKLDNLFYYDDF